ncbi:hypothetical protein DSECCO2_520610 [anaerobic digester metagenome]
MVGACCTGRIRRGAIAILTGKIYKRRDGRFKAHGFLSCRVFTFGLCIGIGLFGKRHTQCAVLHFRFWPVGITFVNHGWHHAAQWLCDNEFVRINHFGFTNAFGLCNQ